jgi:hypothetical protein
LNGGGTRPRNTAIDNKLLSCYSYFERSSTLSETKGFVIESENGTFLVKGLFWYPRERPQDAYVHAENEIETIRELSRGWPVKPTKMYQAIFTEGCGVVILGEPCAFKPPLDKIKQLHQADVEKGACIYCHRPMAEWEPMEECPVRTAE